MTRIALIHALIDSMEPATAAFARDWPDADLVHLLDSSLSQDVARPDRAAGIAGRIHALSRYAQDIGSDAILFTCSAFGPAIDAARDGLSIPVRKPSEAVIREATELGGRIALVATFAPTLRTMPCEFPPDARILPVLAEGALEALKQRHPAQHDAQIAQAAKQAGCDVVVLAQFSSARAAEAVRKVFHGPVLTTPGAAVRDLRECLMARR